MTNSRSTRPTFDAIRIIPNEMNGSAESHPTMNTASAYSVVSPLFSYSILEGKDKIHDRRHAPRRRARLVSVTMMNRSINAFAECSLFDASSVGYRVRFTTTPFLREPTYVFLNHDRRLALVARSWQKGNEMGLYILNYRAHNVPDRLLKHLGSISMCRSLRR